MSKTRGGGGKDVYKKIEGGGQGCIILQRERGARVSPTREAGGGARMSLRMSTEILYIRN